MAVQLNKNHIRENELKSNCKLINFKLKFSNFRYWIWIYRWVTSIAIIDCFVEFSVGCFSLLSHVPMNDQIFYLKWYNLIIKANLRLFEYCILFHHKLVESMVLARRCGKNHLLYEAVCMSTANLGNVDLQRILHTYSDRQKLNIYL